MLNRVVPSSHERGRHRLVLPVYTDSSSPVVQHAATRRRWRSIRCGLLRSGARFHRWEEERGGKKECVSFLHSPAARRSAVHQTGHQGRRGAAARTLQGARRHVPQQQGAALPLLWGARRHRALWRTGGGRGAFGRRRLDRRRGRSKLQGQRKLER